MTGIAPGLPSSGWKVIYEPALSKFLSNPDNLQFGGAVSDWIVGCRRDGPPDAVSADEDFYLAGIPDTELTVEFLVIDFEFLVIIKSFA